MRKSGLIAGIIFISLIACSSFNNKSAEVPSGKRQVLWSRTDSTYNNFRIPALIVTTKGTVLAFAEGREGGDSGDIDILLKRSEDGGRSWSQQAVVWNDDNNTCGNPCPVIDQNTGRIILFMTWNLGSDHEDMIIRKKSSNTRKPYMCYSDDDGLSWSEPVDMSTSCKDPDWGWYATGPGVGIQLKSEKFRNRLVIPANHSYDVQNKNEAVRGGYGYGSHVLYSDDGGMSWSRSEDIRPGCNESQVAELSKGDLMMNMRSYNKMSCRAIAVSKDGGASWSDIKHDHQLVEPVCQASIIDYGPYQGNHMHLFSNPATKKERTHMTVKVSFDDCQSWNSETLIHRGPSAYSCMTVLPDGSIGLFFEAGENDPYESLVFVSIKPDELIK
jgi:sialidase-1